MQIVIVVKTVILQRLRDLIGLLTAQQVQSEVIGMFRSVCTTDIGMVSMIIDVVGVYHGEYLQVIIVIQMPQVVVILNSIARVIRPGKCV